MSNKIKTDMHIYTHITICFLHHMYTHIYIYIHIYAYAYIYIYIYRYNLKMLVCVKMTIFHLPKLLSFKLEPPRFKICRLKQLYHEDFMTTFTRTNRIHSCKRKFVQRIRILIPSFFDLLENQAGDTKRVLTGTESSVTSFYEFASSSLGTLESTVRDSTVALSRSRDNRRAIDRHI